jgi:DNA-binding NarL/FixJ family response regulator
MTKRRVVIADDHPTILQRVVEMLSAEYEIVAAVGDGLAAVDAACALQPDLIVLDISMPGMTGLEAAARIAAFAPPPPILFLTVHEDPVFFEAARQVGACGYVLKRALAADLLPATRRVLDGQSVFPVLPHETVRL